MENKTEKIRILKYCVISFLLFLVIILLTSMISAQNTTTTLVKYCCEKTTYGAWCQNAPQEECDLSNGLRKTPTSCEATSYCKLGCCYDSSEGVCMENTPGRVCQDKGGTWSEGKDCSIPQCNLGCCVLGKQAAFVTLTRCKKLSSFYGLLTDFRGNIGTELECISLASLSDEGACVYELDYTKTCKFTSRQECNSMKEGIATGNGTVTGIITFYKDYLCSNEELGTNCGLTKETTCVEGKDEVYFKDSCGNPANIYDANKVDDKSYWRKIVSKIDSCNPGSSTGNAGSTSCGNCDYFSGSICKDYKKTGISPKYGNNICAGLNCKTTSLGKEMAHGESWCSTDKNEDSVGSRYFRHLCMNGEEIIEPCADFRQEVCIEDKITTTGGSFSQAACRVNRWQDCYSQKEKIDCENIDKRDCTWISDKESVRNNTIACYPLNSPGLKFWEEGESQGICSQANIQCAVTFTTEGIIFGQDKKCTDNCECLTDAWKQEQLKKCEAIGDCGAKINYVGAAGNKEGYKFKEGKAKTTGKAVEEEQGGLFSLNLILGKLGITGKAVQVEVEDIEQEKV